MNRKIPKQSFKGIKTIPYPSNDIIQRWASKERAGEMRLKDENGRWDFNPLLQVSDIENLENTIIELSSNNLETLQDRILNYDEIFSIKYHNGDMVLFISSNPNIYPINNHFKELSLYLNIQNAFINESPETHLNKWQLINSLNNLRYTLKKYNIEDIISYISQDFEKEPTNSFFKDEYLYKCIISTEIGESPQSHPYKWERLLKINDIMFNSFKYSKDDIISFIDVNIETFPFENHLKFEYLYKCLTGTLVGENPKTHPNKWKKLDLKQNVTPRSIIIDDVLGLDVELEKKIEYSNIFNNLNVTSDNKIKLDVNYITLSDYSISIDIRPNPISETKIGKVIWKIKNETWNDGGPGIFQPRFDINTPAPIEDYGYLYTVEAAKRLLSASPGYRMFNNEDIKNTFGLIPLKEGISKSKHCLDFRKNNIPNSYWKAPNFWGNFERYFPEYIWDIDTFSNLTGLSLVESGMVHLNFEGTSPVWENAYFAKSGQFGGSFYLGAISNNSFDIASFIYTTVISSDNDRIKFLNISALFELSIIETNFIFPNNNNTVGINKAFPVRLVKDI